MDLFEEIRREYEFGVASISGAARKFGVHRRMVREAIECSIPMRLPAKERPRPIVGPVASFMDEILEADRQAPRKQRHTAHRIWVRITKERSGHPISESTVRRYVRQRKRTLGLRVAPEAFVPQQYAWRRSLISWPVARVMDMTPCSHRAWITPAGVPHMTTPPTTTTGLPELRLKCYNR